MLLQTLKQLILGSVLLAGCQSCGFAQDLLAIVYEDSSITIGGKTFLADEYYILVGDDGRLEKGDIINLRVRHDQPGRYVGGKGRFVLAGDNIKIVWPVGDGQKYGSVEKGKFSRNPAFGSGLMTYKIANHSGDSSQNGKSYKVRTIEYSRLPQWARDYCYPTIFSKLSRSEQKTHLKIQDEWLKHREQMNKILFDY